MSLSDSDRELIRDEVGVSPTDDEIDELYDDLGESSWIPTALRVLRRRRSGMAASGASSVAVPGVVSVSFTSSIATIDRQIDRLERQLALLNVNDSDPCSPSSSHVQRQTYRSG